MGLATLITAVALTLGPSGQAVDPALSPGPWHQAGKTATSGKKSLVIVQRTLLQPTAMAFVVRAPAGRKVRVRWDTQCQRDSDEDEQDLYGTLSGTRPLVFYPPVYEGAQLCFMWVRATSAGTSHITVGIYAY